MKGWLKLLSFMGLIFLFMGYAPKILRFNKIYLSIEKSSAEKGIDNSSVFYSEEPQSYKSEKEIKERLTNR